MKALINHTSYETAYVVQNYPYGSLRTEMRYWVETTPKRGDRFCSCTINPKNGRINAPKKSTYVTIGCMYLNDIGHVKFHGVHEFSKKTEVEDFINEYLPEDSMNTEQYKQYCLIMGIKAPIMDDFELPQKEFSVKWEKDNDGKCDEVKITFDRPDGVSLKEIFLAMKSLNQTKLKEVFEIRHSKTFGDYPGTVRICVRKGFQLACVSEDTYNEWMASDFNTTLEEA